MRLFLCLSFLFLLSCVTPQPVLAHAFGQLYNLPVPFWMYLYGAAAAIILSFLIIGFFLNTQKNKLSYPTIPLTILSFATNTNFILIIKITTVLLFLFTIITGLIGQDLSSANINMNLFWIMFVLGTTYFIGIFGNVWEVINPIKTLIEWSEDKFGISMQPVIEYPKNASYYPALIFYFLFIWIELFAKTSPFSLSVILIFYLLISHVGTMIIGKKDWFAYCDFFSVFFRLFGKMGIFEYKKKQLYIRPPLVGLLTGTVESFSLLLFILFMLSSTAFDGLHSTTPWIRFYFSYIDGVFHPLFGENAFEIFQNLGLLLSPFIFLTMYMFFTFLAKVITNTTLSLMELLLQFGYSLIPIALAYNIAHYYTLLITEGQNIYRLISDPFGYGWNLFGTKSVFTLYIPDANFIWHSQVGIILLGHITGVYIAHVIALRVFPTHQKALVSQLPMLVLMVLYTMIGLWILSQPITSG